MANIRQARPVPFAGWNSNTDTQARSSFIPGLFGWTPEHHLWALAGLYDVETRRRDAGAMYEQMADQRAQGSRPTGCSTSRRTTSIPPLPRPKLSDTRVRWTVRRHGQSRMAILADPQEPRSESGRRCRTLVPESPECLDHSAGRAGNE